MQTEYLASTPIDAEEQEMTRGKDQISYGVCLEDLQLFAQLEEGLAGQGVQMEMEVSRGGELDLLELVTGVISEQQDIITPEQQATSTKRRRGDLLVSRRATPATCAADASRKPTTCAPTR